MIFEVHFSPELVLGSYPTVVISESYVYRMLSAGRAHRRVLGCPAEEGPTGYSDLPPQSVLSRHSVSATWTLPYTEKRRFVRKLCKH